MSIGDQEDTVNVTKSLSRLYPTFSCIYMKVTMVLEILHTVMLMLRPTPIQAGATLEILHN